MLCNKSILAFQLDNYLKYKFYLTQLIGSLGKKIGKN